MNLPTRPALARLLFAAALAACVLTPAAAAIIPPGTQLSPRQELVRNNGDEPETMDPALTESVSAGSRTIPLDARSAMTARRSSATGTRAPSGTPRASASCA